jgi:hypothetical protein
MLRKHKLVELAHVIDLELAMLRKHMLVKLAHVVDPFPLSSSRGSRMD